MSRKLPAFVVIVTFSSVATAETRIESQRYGLRGGASVYLETSPATIDRLIADVRGYNRRLPRLIRARSMDTVGRRMRIDLRWP
jgi:hypothetical protein